MRAKCSVTNCVRKYLSSGAGPLGFVREAVVLHDLGAADVGDADDERFKLPHFLDDAEVEGEEAEGDERDREQGDFEVRVHDEGGAEELDVLALGVVEGRELVRGCGHGVLGVGARARTACWEMLTGIGWRPRGDAGLGSGGARVPVSVLGPRLGLRCAVRLDRRSNPWAAWGAPYRWNRRRPD